MLWTKVASAFRVSIQIHSCPQPSHLHTLNDSPANGLEASGGIKQHSTPHSGHHVNTVPATGLVGGGLPRWDQGLHTARKVWKVAGLGDKEALAISKGNQEIFITGLQKK